VPYKDRYDQNQRLQSTSLYSQDHDDIDKPAQQQHQRSFSQAILPARGNLYKITILSDNLFTAANRVNCVAPFGKSLSLTQVNFVS
jgi:hypothetical protein